MASQMPRRRQALWAVTALSSVATIALVAFLAILSAGLASSNQSIRAVAIVACILEIVALLAFAASIFREFTAAEHVTTQEKTRLRARRWLMILASSLLSCIGAATTIATVAWTAIETENIKPIIGVQPSAIIALVIVLLILSLVSEAAVFALLLSESKGSPPAVGLSLPMKDHSSRAWPEVISERHSKDTNDRHRFDVAPSTTCNSSAKSFRSSLTISTRPSSARNPPVSSHPPSVSESHFDSWDTSGVPVQLRDTVHSRSTPQGRVTTILPPIPGSRPASPAKALDGPFLPPSPHPSQLSPTPTSPENPARFYSPPTSPPPIRPPIKTSPSFDSIPRPFALALTIGSSGSLESLSLPRNYSQNSLVNSVSHLPARDVRVIGSEENIHPLFRASSPTPPPGASAGTILMAATIEEAVAGLEENNRKSREISRSRAASAAGNYPMPDLPSSRNRSRAGSRSGTPAGILLPPIDPPKLPAVHSTASTSTLRAMPESPGASTPLTPADSSRGPTPDSRASPDGADDSRSDASGAIPDFITAAAKRRSLEGFERRKSTRSSATTKAR